MKRCSKCHEIKPDTEFYKDKRTKDGLKCQCKKCHCKTSISTRDENNHREQNKKYMKRRYQRNPEKVRAYWRTHKKQDAQKVKARNLLNNAVRYGKIKRPNCCERCGSVGMVYAHHDDYSKPFDVKWLCSDCHGKQHRKKI